jgi:hypothetical protein
LYQTTSSYQERPPSWKGTILSDTRRDRLSSKRPGVRAITTRDLVTIASPRVTTFGWRGSWAELVDLLAREPYGFKKVPEVSSKVEASK